MPRGDGTGPWGAGPVTGRGLGWCPGYRGSGFGFPSGRAWGHGYGAGRSLGWRNAGYWCGPGAELNSVAQERAVLQRQLEAIQSNLTTIDQLMGAEGSKQREGSTKEDKGE